MAQTIIAICVIIYVALWCGHLTFKFSDKAGRYFGLEPYEKIEMIFFEDGYIYLLMLGLTSALAAWYAFVDANFFLCFVWSLISICEIAHYCYFGKPK